MAWKRSGVRIPLAPRRLVSHGLRRGRGFFRTRLDCVCGQDVGAGLPLVLAGYRRECGALGRRVGGGVLPASSVWTAVPLFGPRESVWTAVACGVDGPNRRKGSEPAQGGPSRRKGVQTRGGSASVHGRCTPGSTPGRAGRERADRHHGRGGRGPAGGAHPPLGACDVVRPDFFIGVWQIGQSPCPRGPCSHGPHICPRMPGTGPDQPPDHNRPGFRAPHQPRPRP